MLKLLAGGASIDGLMEAAGLAIVEQAKPLLAEIRANLLDRITGDPPATFGPALRRNGLDLPADVQLQLWRSVVAAIADEEIHEQEALRAV